jgi:hypothetical protein
MFELLAIRVRHLMSVPSLGQTNPNPAGGIIRRRSMLRTVSSRLPGSWRANASHRNSAHAAGTFCARTNASFLSLAASDTSRGVQQGGWYPDPQPRHRFILPAPWDAHADATKESIFRPDRNQPNPCDLFTPIRILVVPRRPATKTHDAPQPRDESLFFSPAWRHRVKWRGSPSPQSAFHFL